MFNIAVLISGCGSNLKSLIDNQKEYYKINVVIADRDCGGLNIAREANIDAVLIDRKEYREKLSKKIDEELKKYNIDLIVLAGYLSIVDLSLIHISEPTRL